MKFLLTGLVVSFCGAAGPQERIGEKVELASGYFEPTPVGSSRGCGIFSIGSVAAQWAPGPEPSPLLLVEAGKG